MPRSLNRLSARQVQTIKTPGRHADGGNLYLSIGKDGGRRWVFFYVFAGKQREMGLGSARDVKLAAARQDAEKARAQVAAGIDPIAARKVAEAKSEGEPTFEDCGTKYLDANRSAWKNAKHAAQWESTLKRYAYPIMGHLRVSQVVVGHVMEVLDPIWNSKTETASRVRGRIETIIDWATARGFRSGENPARWRGHLDQMLPKRSKVQKVKHHPAMPYGEVAAFMADLRRERTGAAARALEFAILTAARTTETTHARRREIDFAARTWTIPANRMKADREHRVPLSAAAISVLESVGAAEDGDPDAFIFTNDDSQEPLSNNGMLALLERMKRDDVTVHGFRSTFRDWASETTNFPNEVVEMALAHTIKDKSEAAYRRGDLFAKRVALMKAWAIYCSSPAKKASASAKSR